MERTKLDKTHVGLQFLMMLIAILGFLILTVFVGNIVWFKDFQYFVVLLSGIFAIFIAVIALLRYYTQRQNILFLFLGIGFLVVGLLDIVQLVFDISDFKNLFLYTPGEIYPFSSILSRGFLSVLLFLGWFLGTKSKRNENIKKYEKMVMFSVIGLFFVFGAIVTYFVLSNIILESLWVVIAGIATLMLLILAFVGYMFRREWEYDNFDFWLIFSVSFLLLSQVFFLPLLNLEYENMINLSTWAKFFGYVALLIGFLNSIYEMYQREVSIQKELEKKNKLLDETKKKVEEAYLVVRKEKWDLVDKKKVLKKK